jgi:hypothetical protein
MLSPMSSILRGRGCEAGRATPSVFQPTRVNVLGACRQCLFFGSRLYLCLSRACLDTMLVFEIHMAQTMVFRTKGFGAFASQPPPGAAPVNAGSSTRIARRVTLSFCPLAAFPEVSAVATLQKTTHLSTLPMSVFEPALANRDTTAKMKLCFLPIVL